MSCVVAFPAELDVYFLTYLSYRAPCVFHRAERAAETFEQTTPASALTITDKYLFAAFVQARVCVCSCF